MEREGDIITFNAVDRSRYPRLKEWMSIEGVPGLFEELTEAQLEAVGEQAEAQSLDVMDEAEHARLHKLVAAGRKLQDLDLLKSQLAKRFPDEIAASLSIEDIMSDIPGVGSV